MKKNKFLNIFLGVLIMFLVVFFSITRTSAETLPIIDFESYSTSLAIDGQDGWNSDGAAGSGCAVYDHKFDSSFSTAGFGSQSLRISNAVTSGCFGDMTFSKPLVNSVGETGSTAGTFSAGTKQTRFEMQFDVASVVPAEQQPGLFVSVSPDRGDGSRMSYLGFGDVAGGINVIFYDVQGTTNPANFVSTDLGTYSRSVKHTVRLVMDVVDGPSNDVVQVYIDGVLTHTGTSWENYYRFDSEASAEQSPRIVKSVLFRTGGTAAPATAGKGFLFDNLTVSSGASVTPTLTPTPTVNPFAVPAQCQNIAGLNTTPIIGTANGDKINGTNGNDLIFALGGGDVVDGKNGNDCIVGGAGGDKLTGGNGNDVIIGGADGDSIEGGNNTDTIYGDAGSDSISGGNDDDTIYGGDDPDSISGDNGDDVIEGNAGNDSLKGGNGEDKLLGGEGIDSVNGNNGTDNCSAESASSCEV